MIETNYKTISYGKVLRDVMEKNRISILKLSQITDISPETIQRLRDNKPCGNIVDHAFTICTALKLNPYILEMLLSLGAPGHQFNYSEQIRRYEYLSAR